MLTSLCKQFKPSFAQSNLRFRSYATSAAAPKKTVLKVARTPVAGFENKRVQITPIEKEEEAPKPIDTSKWTKSYFEAPIINFQKEIVGSLELDKEVFGERIRPDIIHRVLIQRLKAKENDKGIKATKRSVDVNGSTRKLYSQKGRGAARHSTKKAPQFRGGGVSHGRKLRDLRLNIPARVLKLGMRSALSAKFAQGKIILIDQLTFEKFSSIGLKVFLQKKGWPVFQILFLDFPSLDPQFFNSSRKVKDLLIMKAYQCNIWDILRREYIVLTPQALAEITRIYKP